MSQITTPSGDTIGMKYNTQPVSKYFTLASIDYGKVWS
jgi:hypothetical protein